MPKATDATFRGKRIRGLTLWRPWPWAFTHADKRVENRTWAPPLGMVGGYLALHAGQKFDYSAALAMQQGEFTQAATALPAKTTDHHKGVIVAIARLEGYHRLQCDPHGWEFGPFVWQLPRISVLRFPVPCLGSQRLWKLPPAALAAVTEQMQGTD